MSPYRCYNTGDSNVIALLGSDEIGQMHRGGVQSYGGVSPEISLKYR